MENPLPPLSEKEYESLKESITQHGVRVPVLVDEEGGIIDGHHRVQIAEELGIYLPKEVVKGLNEHEKLALAVELNVKRRQLTSAQKQDAVLRLAEERPDWYSTRELGAMFGVDHSTASRWLKPKDSSQPSRSVANATPGISEAPAQESRFKVEIGLDSETYQACQDAAGEDDVGEFIERFLREHLVGRPARWQESLI